MNFRRRMKDKARLKAPCMVWRQGSIYYIGPLFHPAPTKDTP